ncbi:LLM class flavin-dependent oxidoreductase [Conexibacter sp. SYSU D00693]|uniref:LLM class flavin-dependent oxidoreductase n=1 Tax=Conexibacter sp. SYSU D00693 TaxID=2812560 RepID=UPI00196AD64B|nr:LLM class flavin-dependent oxidoreductase [Conexibacter sp. SYSU D00693]
MLRLSVLDQSPIAEGATGAQALQNTLELARLADRLGFHRYWVAEHHGGPSLAGPAPEVLIGPIAAATQRLRVGSGGVMLPHYSPLHVAEQFSVLAGLCGDRIDLGIGRASGTDPLTTFALQRDRRQASPDDFPDQLAELLAHLEDDLPADHPFARLPRTLPGRPQRPRVWLLGSSPQSALWAAELSLPYAFADFINPQGARIAADYRQRFVAGRGLDDPEAVVAVWALAADTEDEALELATSSRMMFSLLRQGRLIAVPTPDKAMAWARSRGEDPRKPREGRRTIVGDPAQVRAGIEAAAQEYGAREVVVVTITHSHAARLRSYELIAREFGLDAVDAAPPVVAQA